MALEELRTIIITAIACCSSILVLDLAVPAFLVLHMERGTIFGLEPRL
jgi:hypothetical protein